jgi:Holliday junction resolvasome RuvABC DNA-binding subunit
MAKFDREALMRDLQPVMQKAKQEISDGITTLSILGATKQDIDELVTKIYDQVKELTKDWIKM